MSRAWVVPLGSQLDLLVRWLEPLLDRPGLTRAETLQIVVAEAGDEDRSVDFEPFDALVGPVRVAPEGIVAGVIPHEPFAALRKLVGADGDYEPVVVFAHADGSRELEPIEAVASEAVYVETLVLADIS